jgi:hypothetical protein
LIILFVSPQQQQHHHHPYPHSHSFLLSVFNATSDRDGRDRRDRSPPRNRNRSPPRRNDLMPPPLSANARSNTDTPKDGKERELKELQKVYLGVKKEKKKIRKPSEKMKFVFDWEVGEDTSRDFNPLYDHKHEAQLLFGRGKRGGFDTEHQPVK